MFYKGERTALFIDGPNLHNAARGLNFSLDYKKVLDYFKARTELVRAFYYSALADTSGGPEANPVAIKPLLDWLDYNGYHLVTKATKQYEDSYGNLRTKANMDVEIAIDMLQQSSRLDHAVLFSGDGDFHCLVKACQQYCRVTVISTVQSSPPMCADNLRRQADIFIDLADMKTDFGRQQDGYICLRRRSAAGDEPELGDEGPYNEPIESERESEQ